MARPDWLIDEDKITTLKNNLTPDREDTVASVVVFTADDAKPGFSSNYGGGGITIADQEEEEVVDESSNELEKGAGGATIFIFLLLQFIKYFGGGRTGGGPGLPNIQNIENKCVKTHNPDLRQFFLTVSRELCGRRHT